MKNQDGDLAMSLTIFQLFLLLQTKSLERTQGSFEAVAMAHALTASPTHQLAGTACSETDWTERAQALALERLGLVIPNQECSRWTLTPEGESAVRKFREMLDGVLPDR